MRRFELLISPVLPRSSSIEGGTIPSSHSGSVVLSSIVCVLSLGIAHAHHSRAEFAGDVVELEGTIVSTMWTNPHPYVVVKASDAEYRVELYGNLFTNERLGLSREQFVAGAPLKTAGVPSTRRPGYVLGYNLLFANGSEVVLTTLSAPRWTDRVIEGTDAVAEYEAQRTLTAKENRGLFRVWTPSGRTGFGTLSLPYTESAIAARAKWDELDNFLTRCEQPGMPRAMLTPQEYEFVDDGDVVRIHAQFFDTTRIVHLADAEPSAEQPASHLGYSVGHWENGTLVVETTRIDWPYFDVSGTPQSNAMHVIERFSVSEDQSRLNIRMTLTYPATFTEPAVIDMEWLALGRTIQPYDCRVL